MNNNENICQNGFELLAKYRGALMGVATLSIYIFHAWIPITLEPHESSVFLLSFLEHYFKAIGFTGVDVFLLLSGMGLTYAINKGSITRFYYRRIRRIIIPFWALGIIRGIVQKWGLTTIIGNLSGYNFYMKDTNSFLWFIPAIITLYLFFPLYYKLFGKFKNKFLFTSAVILIWLVVSILVSNIMRRDLYGFTNRIPIFVIGILFGYIAQNYKNIVFTIKSYICLICTLALGLFLIYITSFNDVIILVPISNCFLPTLLIAISSSLLLAKLFELLERCSERFGKIVIKTLVFFGMISLEFYCVQSWFIDIIGLLLQDGWSKHIVNISLFLIVTALSWVVSILNKYFWELVESLFKRFNAKKVN